MSIVINSHWQKGEIAVAKQNAMQMPGKVRIIGGKWRGRQIKVADNPQLRPTPDRVRETLFNWLANYIVDARCLDLFAGTGVLGFEALSRGAKEVVWVDNELMDIKQIQQITQTLKIEQGVQIIYMDALAYLEQNLPENLPFDIIFLDPPFNSPLLEQSLKRLVQSSLVETNTLIYIEAAHGWNAEAIPSFWEILKQKTAGQVDTYLVQVGEL